MTPFANGNGRTARIWANDVALVAFNACLMMLGWPMPPRPTPSRALPYHEPSCTWFVVPTHFMLYIANMPARPVQVSLDTALLERIDADPETRARGRSAFVRAAVEQYLETKARQEIDAQIAAAYAGQTDAALAETAELLEAQAWPDD